MLLTAGNPIKIKKAVPTFETASFHFLQSSKPFSLTILKLLFNSGFMCLRLLCRREIEKILLCQAGISAQNDLYNSGLRATNFTNPCVVYLLFSYRFGGASTPDRLSTP
jgi:hypothetical protein